MGVSGLLMLLLSFSNSYCHLESAIRDSKLSLSLTCALVIVDLGTSIH
jgi:hypothetical protein